MKDYQAFVEVNPSYNAGTDWKSPGFTQTEDHPVVGVSWDDAHAFCDWLTKKEQSEGKLASNQQYRLPTDVEWKKAVGWNEISDGKPEYHIGHEIGVGPWDIQSLPLLGPGSPHTSPVGSFAANRNGLYDMADNVWEWSEDKWSEDKITKKDHDGNDDGLVHRASWSKRDPEFLNKSITFGQGLSDRSNRNGFRVVVVAKLVPDTTSTQAAPDDLLAFFRAQWDHMVDGEADLYASDFSSQADYCFARGQAGDVNLLIINDRQQFLDRWPIRHYSNGHTTALTMLSKDSATYTMEYDYEYQSSNKFAQGHCQETINANKVDKKWQITRFDEEENRK